LVIRQRDARIPLAKGGALLTRFDEQFIDDQAPDDFP
jgi:hypothetical protein